MPFRTGTTENAESWFVVARVQQDDRPSWIYKDTNFDLGAGDLAKPKTQNREGFIAAPKQQARWTRRMPGKYFFRNLKYFLKLN